MTGVSGEITDLAHHVTCPAEFGEGIASALGRVVEFDGRRLLGIAPEGVVPSFHLGRDSHGDCRRLFERDLYGFRDLQRAPCPARVLGGDGALARDCGPLPHDEMGPPGVISEMRIAIGTGRTLLAGLVLLRRRPHRPFADREADRVGRLVPMISQALRRPVPAVPPTSTPLPPGVVVLDRRGHPDTISAAAYSWFVELAGASPVCRDSGLPHVVVQTGLTAAARSEAATCLQTPTGRWLHLHGSALDDTRTVVVLQQATARQILPALALRHAFTRRECEVLDLVARGCPDKHIASALGISRHTVNDHLKSLFAKAGVHRRDELVARLLS
ncbi:response regulator transcription factor [Embleya sp. NPDC001921]